MLQGNDGYHGGVLETVAMHPTRFKRVDFAKRGCAICKTKSGLSMRLGAHVEFAACARDHQPAAARPCLPCVQPTFGGMFRLIARASGESRLYGEVRATRGDFGNHALLTNLGSICLAPARAHASTGKFKCERTRADNIMHLFVNIWYMFAVLELRAYRVVASEPGPTACMHFRVCTYIEHGGVLRDPRE